MTVALGNYTGNCFGNGTSVTVGSACSGSDRLLLASGHVWGGSVTNITWNGTSLTKQVDSNYCVGYHSAWSMVAPAAVSANVVFTNSVYARMTGGFAFWTGVDQTTSWQTPLTYAENTSTSIDTGSLTCPTDGAMWCAIFGRYLDSLYTVNNGTTLWNARDGANGHGGAHLYRTDTGNFKVTNNASGYLQVLHAFRLNAVAAAAALRPVPVTVLDAVNRASNW